MSSLGHEQRGAGTPLSHGAARPWWSRLGGLPWWMFLLLGVTLLAVAVSGAAIRTADQQRQTLLLVADATADINAYTALEWKAVGPAPLDGEFWAAVREQREVLRRDQLRLKTAAAQEASGASRWMQLAVTPGEVPGERLSSVAALVGEYLRLTDVEFGLLRQNNRAGASAVDETQVDPLAHRLARQIHEVRALRAPQAERALNLAVLLGGVTLLTGLSTVALLARRLRHATREARQQAMERQAEREREDRDSLTGLWNRRGLQRLFARWTAQGELTVLVLDLNRLKVINDSGGHAAGDAHLRRVALALLEVSQPHGLASRWGGDEFVLLLPGVSVPEAQRLAEQAAALLERPGDMLPPFAYGAAHVPVATSLDRVLALADAAMYEHKEQQRHQVARLGWDRAGVTVEEFTARLEQLETPLEVLEEGLALACQVLDFDGSVYLERVGDDFLLRRLNADLAGELRAGLDGCAHSAGADVLGQAIEHSATRWSNDYPSEGPADAWQRSGLKSVVVVPVRYGGRLMGLVGLVNFSAWRVVTPQARRLMEALGSRLGHIFERVQAVENVRSALQGGLLALGTALEERDLETAGHTARVVELASQMGARLGMNDTKLDALRQGASLHDIGKLVIPDAILRKPGPLDAAEWHVMRNHAARGYEIAHRLSGLLPTTLEVIRSHHERWDGSGYPDGLRGEAIPLPARIFAVCDVYDALTHARPYKEAWSHEAAVAEIRAQSGIHFDPQVVEAFIALLEARQTPPLQVGRTDAPPFDRP